MSVITAPRLLSRMRRREHRRVALVTGLVLVLGLCAAGLLAPLLAPHSPVAQYPGEELRGYGGRFLLGTDDLGRDTLSRTLYACRAALLVGLLGVGIGATVGSLIGLVIGYVGGRLDSFVMRLTDIGIGFPVVIVGIVVVAIGGPGPQAVIIAIALYYLPAFVRILRGSALQLRARPFVEAAASMGVKDRVIVLRHVLPNALPLFVLQVGLALPDAVLLDAGLSFIGLGAPPPSPTLGDMLSQARSYLDVPRLAIVPGLALCLLVIGLNLLADGVRDVLDPRESSERAR
ncbi:MAG: ABC transporter permease [Nocardioidaceae bacterium]|nr:ABC transporter permease [Nocardioidaceae bacterium]